MPESQHALELLRRALAAQIAGDVQGPTSLAVVGTVNIIGAGSGGTSQIDNSSFVPGAGSITPIGGYFGGRQVSSGRTAAPAIDGSGVLQVNVVAGGAGGGNANLTTRGTANNDLHVGFASGAAGADGNALLPVVYGSGFYPTVNVGAAIATVNLANIPTVNLGAGITGAVTVTGSVGVGGLGGSVGVTQIGAPWIVVGSVNVTSVASGTVNLGTAITTAGTSGAAFHVGVASGPAGNDGNYAIPVIFASGFYPTVNSSGGGGGGFATVGVYGSVSIGGSAGFVGLGGSVGVTQITSPWVVTGSVNITGSINPVGVFGSVGANATVFFAIGADTTNSALRVNVVAGGAGGGVANLTVRGTANTDQHVGFASGAAGADGNQVMPVIYASGFYPTVNIVGGGAGGGFASVGVYGSVMTTGSQFVTGVGGSFPVFGAGGSYAVYGLGGSYAVQGFGGSMGMGGLGGSIGVTQITSPWLVTGSVNVSGSLGVWGSMSITGSVNVSGSLGVWGSMSVVGSVNVTAVNTQTVWLTNVGVVDTSASIVPTTYIIAAAASGNNTIAPAPSGAAGPRVMFYDITLITDATIGATFQSPSGTNITGSLIQLLPGAGFAKSNVIHSPVLMGGSGNAATVFLYLNNSTAHVVGWAQGYTGTGN